MAYKRKGAKRWSKKKTTKTTSNTKRIRKIARQVVLRNSEPKHKNASVGKVELFHNNLTGIAHINAPLATYMPQLGSQDNMRIGDRIIVRNFEVRCLFGQKRDRPNITFRMICTAQRPGTGPLSYNLLFETSTNNGMLDKVNTDRCTVLWQKWIKPGFPMSSHTLMPGAEEYGQEYTFVRRFIINRKKTYVFESDGGSQHNDRDIWLYVVPYDAFGTLDTDNIAYVQTWVDINYKDL